MSVGGNKAIFLDRDGTINIEKHYLYKIEDFEYADGAVEGLRKLAEMGYLLIVVTNQSGIARGYYSEEDYKKLDSWMKADLLEKGVRITESCFCPHLTDGKIKKYAVECECRKPKTKLFWDAAEKYSIDMDASFAIGDKKRDLTICEESGVTGILLGPCKGKEEKGFFICSDWSEIVETIKRVNAGKNGS